MVQENISQEVRLKNMDGTRNYFIEEINKNDLMSKKDKNVLTALNYIEHSLISAFVITGCVSISAFASLVGIPMSIANSAAVLKIYAITAELRSMIIKKKRSMAK